MSGLEVSYLSTLLTDGLPSDILFQHELAHEMDTEEQNQNQSGINEDESLSIEDSDEQPAFLGKTKLLG